MTLETFDRLWAVPLLIAVFGLLIMQVSVYVKRKTLIADMVHLWPWNGAVAFTWFVNIGIEFLKSNWAMMIISVFLATIHGYIAWFSRREMLDRRVEEEYQRRRAELFESYRID